MFGVRDTTGHKAYLNPRLRILQKLDVLHRPSSLAQFEVDVVAREYFSILPAVIVEGRTLKAVAITTFDGGAGIKWIKVSETILTMPTIAANVLNSCHLLNPIKNISHGPSRGQATAKPFYPLWGPWQCKSESSQWADTDIDNRDSNVRNWPLADICFCMAYVRF